MSTKCGFDIDGVLTIGIMPGPDDIIITGRSFEEIEETIIFLKEKDINNRFFLNPVKYDEKTREKSALHKVRVIKEEGVERFFEDDPIQFDIIKKECPDIELVRIDHGGLVKY